MNTEQVQQNTLTVARVSLAMAMQCYVMKQPVGTRQSLSLFREASHHLSWHCSRASLITVIQHVKPKDD